MPSTNGFVKLNRSIMNCEWFEDNNTLAVLVRLTLSAEWQDTTYKGVELKRGQLVTTIPKIAQSNQLTVQQTRTILDRLKSTGIITVKSTPKFSIITLNNVDCNSENNSQINRQSAENQQTEQQTNNIPTLLYKENKNIRSSEEGGAAVSDILKEAVSEYNAICKSLEPFTAELNYYQARFVVEAHKALHGISFAEYFKRVEESDFLTGKGAKNFKADFNWLIRPENVSKVLSGKYDKSYSGTQPEKPVKKNYRAPLFE